MIEEELNKLEEDTSQRQLSTQEKLKLKQLQEALWTAAQAHESLLRQKARIRWIKQGDCNSRYFHLMLNANRRNNYLKGVMVSGTWFHKPSKVKEEVKAFFSQRFQESSYHRLRLDGICFQKISQHQNDRLTACFQEDEIKQAIWDCGSDKSPGPDGLKINFAKSCFGAFGESDLWKQQAANYLNCRLLVLPFTYLGIPIGANLRSSHQGQLIQKGMKWKVGSGDQIKFWEDKWTGEEESLAEKYPRLYLISLQQHQVIRLMGMYKDIGWEWNFTWRRSLFENEIDSAVNFLSDIADKSIQQQGPDAWVWSEDPAAQYSTRNAYNMLGEEGAAGRQEECFEKLWRIRIPARIAVFAWRLIRDRLPTRQNLRRRQVQITDMLCPFCRIQEEGASHLFFHCNKIQPIWWDTMSWLHIKGAFPLSPKQHFLQHLGVQVDGVRTNRWQYWWLALTWSIWKLRNSIVFSNATFNANSLFEDATFLLWSWLRSFKKDFTVHFNQ
ncbi:putative ribonuclease H protein [Glycine max]|nr:putative ribonuclease H protein [Glycine max]